MFRVGASSLRPLISPNLSRRGGQSLLSARTFSSIRPNGILTKIRPNAWTRPSSRSLMTERQVIQPVQGISWQRVGVTAVCHVFVVILSDY